MEEGGGRGEKEKETETTRRHVKNGARRKKQGRERTTGVPVTRDVEEEMSFDSFRENAGSPRVVIYNY